jgi:hypothetical protein
VADYDPPEFEPPLVPHFPVVAFGPDTPCPHKREYAEGSSLCCMKCHASGKDHYRIFRNVTKPADPKFKDTDLDPFAKASEERYRHYVHEPEPEPTEEKPKPAADQPKLTRRERRRRAFAAIVQTMAPSPPTSA